MPPLLADFIHNRVCELKCEKFLTRPLSPPIPILPHSNEKAQLSLDFFDRLRPPGFYPGGSFN